MTELAPAKINLYLHVCGRRDDGYHLLDSLVAFTAFGDRVTAVAAATLSLDIAGPFAAGLSADADNLVLRAARYLHARQNHNGGARLTLEKNLPVAAGIGGGSSDAAATLRACAALAKTTADNLPPAELAAQLGADVPVCLANKPMRMRGIGEVLEPVPTLPAAWLVLVNPRKPLSTAPVFKALAGRISGPAPEMPARFGSATDFAAFLARCTNDLAAPAREVMPEIEHMLMHLGQTPRCLLAHMSGSGPTCFGLFSTERDARAAAAMLAKSAPNWWVLPTALGPATG